MRSLSPRHYTNWRQMWPRRLQSAVLRYTHRRKRGLTPSINERGTYEKDSFSVGRSGAHFDLVTVRVSENSSGQFWRHAPNEASAQKSGPQLPPEEVISRFTKKESELREI